MENARDSVSRHGREGNALTAARNERRLDASAKYTSETFQTKGESGGSKGRFRIPLLFVFGFLVSVTAVMTVGRLFVGSSPVSSVELKASVDAVMPEALSVKGAGRTVKISDAPGLNPATGGDFLFFIWFKLAKSLGPDGKAVFVGKYDPASKVRPGYSFMLSSVSDGVRPLLYWQDEKGAGRWYAFSATRIRPEMWYMAAISWRKGRLLGLHMTQFGEKKAERLGGYDLEGVESPQNNAELVVGSFGSSSFRGMIGTVGVIRHPDITEELEKTISMLAQSPREMPAGIPGDSVYLWATPKRDMSSQHVEIRSGSSQRRGASH